LRGQLKKDLPCELQGPLFIWRDVRLVVFGEPMQEYIAIADAGRQQCPVAATFSGPRASHAHLVQQAAQAGINPPTFHFVDRHAKRRVGQSFASLPSGKVLSLENSLHRGFFNYTRYGYEVA